MIVYIKGIIDYEIMYYYSRSLQPIGFVNSDYITIIRVKDNRLGSFYFILFFGLGYSMMSHITITIT